MALTLFSQLPESPLLPKIAEIDFLTSSISLIQSKLSEQQLLNLDSLAILAFLAILFLTRGPQTPSPAAPNFHLLNNLADRARAYRSAALADRKTQALFHGHRRNQLNLQ